MIDCPHCGRELTIIEGFFGDFSGCPRTPPCAPAKTLQPSDAWPQRDDGDDGEETTRPVPELETSR